MDPVCEDAKIDACIGSIDVYDASEPDCEMHLETLCTHHAVKRGYFRRPDAPKMLTGTVAKEMYAAFKAKRW